MGTALYVSPEQATGQPLTGSSDVYSLGVVAYECLAGEPPYVAEQPIAIAIMHKHDPIPSLPPDVPRPIADLVYAMLAKNPEERPESARHVADRADIIRDARDGTGRGGPTTSDLPVVPNFPVATSMDLYQGNPERLLDPRRRGNRAFLFAGTGAAAIGAVAIVAVLISGNNGSGVNMGGNVVMPTQSQSQAASHKAAGPRASAAHTVGSNAGVNPGGVMVGATGFAPSSASVGPSKTTRTTPPATHTTAPVHTTPKATIHTTPPATHVTTPPATHITTPPVSSPTAPPASSPPASSPAATSTAKASGAAG
jgi:serine/threonine-protein kinase